MRDQESLLLSSPFANKMKTFLTQREKGKGRQWYVTINTVISI